MGRLTFAILVLQVTFYKEFSIETDPLSHTSSQRVEKRSHADQDHYNALPDLLDRFQIGELVGAWGQTEFQVNLKLGLTPRREVNLKLGLTPRRETPRRDSV